MKEYFTKSSDLLKKQKTKTKMRGGNRHWGTQNHDSHFPDSLPTTMSPNETPLNYRDMNEANGPPFHSEWGKQYAKQSGGTRVEYGAQNHDSHFKDTLPTSAVANNEQLCYRDLNESSGPPFHSEWGKQYCSQGGGKKSDKEIYKAYKKYKQKYKIFFKN